MHTMTPIASWGSRRWQRLLAAVVVVIICWPRTATTATIGLDPSWQAALALARNADLRWGHDIVFTYGPLGYLFDGAFYSYGQSVLATLSLAAALAGLFLGVAAAVRQRHQPSTALAVAFVVTAATTVLLPGAVETVVFASFAWAAVPLLTPETDRALTNRIVVILAFLAGFLLVLKFNTGLSTLALALATSLLIDWRAWKRHGTALGAFAGSVLIWWLVSGQAISALPTWFTLSVEFATGYSAAMGTRYVAGTAPNFALAVAGLWVVALVVAFVRGGAEIPRSFVVLSALVTMIMFKSSFARFDVGHVPMMLTLMIAVIAITPLSGLRRLAVPVVAVTVAAIYLTYPGLATPADVLEPLARGDRIAARRVVDLAWPGRFDHFVGVAKQGQRDSYQVPDALLDHIGDRPVHIDPWEASLAWAYDLNWKPIPTIQSYAAYAPTLDRMNADALVDEPRFVLSPVPPGTPTWSIDGRLLVQESPLYSRALLCNHTVAGIDSAWVLFAPTAPRCGELEPLSTITVRNGEVVAVPQPSRPGSVVLVAIELDVSLLDRLVQTAMFLPITMPSVEVDGITHRLVTANADEPFLVRSGPSVSGTSLVIDANTISVHEAGARPTLSFYEMDVAPAEPPWILP